MKTQHTPGPWIYEQNLRGDGIAIPYSWRVEGNIDPPPGVDEAFLHVADCETEGNAAIIAAAPDLLEACRAVAALMDGQGRKNLPMVAGMARAAVARAEGRAEK